jgi:hypothetical protein
MQTTQVLFRFEGGLADRHRLDPSDLIEHETAARQLLGLHAYFLVTGGRLPNGGVRHRGPAYDVYVEGRDKGSIVLAWVVEIIAKETVGAGARYAARRTWEYGFEDLLRDSLAPILSRRSSSMPVEMRREPVLEGLDRRNDPFIDTEAVRARQWRLLRERTTNILVNLARPVGRSAETLVVVAGNENTPPIGRIDAATLMHLRQTDIIMALSDLGLRPLSRGEPGINIL